MDQLDISEPKPDATGVLPVAVPDGHERSPLPKAKQPADWMRKSWWLRFWRKVAAWLNIKHPWYTQGKVLGYLNLFLQRYVLQHHNLYDTGVPPSSVLPSRSPPADAVACRTIDGAYNDLASPTMGMAKARFGRNIPPSAVCPRAPGGSPSPFEIADKLLTRTEFREAKSINMLAVGWIQFMVHDWLIHDAPARARYMEISCANGRMMRVRRTPTDSGAPAPGGIEAYPCRDTHWWDGAQIYGADVAGQQRVRSRQDGKLWVNADKMLPLDAHGIEISGATDNWWTGLSLFHTLFVLEHNAICEMLKGRHREWDDDKLFSCARLINAALMAKIHVLEWTPTAGGHPTLGWGVKLNWWGVFGEGFVKRFGRLGCEFLTGIPGAPTNHHGVPFSMTEEFVAVYRMHPLLRDTLQVRHLADDSLAEECNLGEVSAAYARVQSCRHGMGDLFYSFAIACPGQLRLNNYPAALRNIERDGNMIDVAVVDLVRDRERGIPRYNDFRRLLHLPPVQSFDDLDVTGEQKIALEKIYGHPDHMDLMIGLFAEKKPDGFAFSDTAFRIFILMASRRLESDRFYTSDYGPQKYTREGIAWVDDSDLATVLGRHYPDLKRHIEKQKIEKIFAPWSKTASSS